MKKQLKCYWCGKFLSEENKTATIKEPNIFYCFDCYKKGLEMEYEAMGLEDKSNL